MTRIATFLFMLLRLALNSVVMSTESREVSSYTELSSLIKATEAEADQHWTFQITEDIRGNHTIAISPNKSITVIGSSSALDGRRVQVTPQSTNNSHGFLRSTDSGSVTVWLENLEISGFAGWDMITMRAKSSLTLKNCRISTNRASVRIEGGSSAIVHGSEFSSNSLFSALSILGPNATVFVRDSAFVDNHVFNTMDITDGNPWYGAGIYVGDDADGSGIGNELDVANTCFARNRAEGAGAAVYIKPGSTVSLWNCTLFDNEADDFGGAIAAVSNQGLTSNLSVAGSVFGNNTAKSHAGAIYVGSRVQLSISNTLFADNMAHGGGGSLASETHTTVISESTFEGNIASTGTGGAILGFGENPKIQIFRTKFAHNTASGAGGGAVSTSLGSIFVVNSKFNHNIASVGAGGALLTFGTTAHLIDVNFTENSAHTHGGAVQSEQTALYPRGASSFVRNIALGSGGAISLNSSSLKTNERALVFLENQAQLGGAISVINKGSVLISPGCQTVRFEMYFEQSSTLAYAEDSHSVVVRRVVGAVRKLTNACPSTCYGYSCDHWASWDFTCMTNEVDYGCDCTGCDCILDDASGDHDAQYGYAYGESDDGGSFEHIFSGDLKDERGDWMFLFPSSAENTVAQFCLPAGEWLVVGSEGAWCFEGWGGGYIRAVDLYNSELLSRFTVTDGDLCTATASMTIDEDATLTDDQGAVRFERNRAKGTSESEFCGLGCGGALYVGESCTADLDRIEFSGNSAADGGALYVDLLGDLVVSRSIMLWNTASASGGAISVGNTATISVSKSAAKHNVAGQFGGMLHLTNIQAAVLRGINATGNEARRGGGIAVFDSTRSAITLASSSFGHNKAEQDGGGIFLQRSAANIVGVTFLENMAEQRDGGGVVARETNALALSDIECVDMEVLLDWSNAGNGCAYKVDWPGSMNCEALVKYWGWTCAEAAGSSSHILHINKHEIAS